MWRIEERCMNVKISSLSSRSVAVGLVARFYIYCILSSIPFLIDHIFPLVCLFHSFTVFFYFNLEHMISYNKLLPPSGFEPESPVFTILCHTTNPLSHTCISIATGKWWLCIRYSIFIFYIHLASSLSIYINLSFTSNIFMSNLKFWKYIFL